MRSSEEDAPAGPPLSSMHRVSRSSLALLRGYQRGLILSSQRVVLLVFVVRTRGSEGGCCAGGGSQNGLLAKMGNHGIGLRGGSIEVAEPWKRRRERVVVVVVVSAARVGERAIDGDRSFASIVFNRFCRRHAARCHRDYLRRPRSVPFSLSLSPSLPSFLSQSLYQSQELPPTRYSYRLNGFLSLYLSLSPSLPPPPPPPPPPLPSFSPCLRLYHDFSFTCLFLPLSLLPSVGDRGVSFRSRGEGSRSREISSSWEGRGAGKRKKKKREKERKEADITH